MSKAYPCPAEEGDEKKEPLLPVKEGEDTEGIGNGREWRLERGDARCDVAASAHTGVVGPVGVLAAMGDSLGSDRDLLVCHLGSNDRMTGKIQRKACSKKKRERGVYKALKRRQWDWSLIQEAGCRSHDRLLGRCFPWH